MKNKFVLLTLCITGVLMIGFISGISTADAINGWYTTIKKPSFNPPNYVFGPVWTVLYAMMGVSLFLILCAPLSQIRSKAIVLFAIQLLLNFFWSIIFFRFGMTGWALLEIIAMWSVIAIMIVQFIRVRSIAGWLQIPYLLWVSFATLLNASIYYLNS